MAIHLVGVLYPARWIFVDCLIILLKFLFRAWGTFHCIFVLNKGVVNFFQKLFFMLMYRKILPMDGFSIVQAYQMSCVTVVSALLSLSFSYFLFLSISGTTRFFP